MITKLLHPLLDSTALKQAADLICAGEVVGMPTETVYGLGANAYDSVAVRKIFEAKGRPQDNPLIIHLGDIEQLPEVCPMITTQAMQLARRFWPGPLTIVLPKSAQIPPATSAGLHTIGVRVPANPLARQLIRMAGVPIAAPSANLSGRPSPTTAQHVMRDMDGKIAAVLDGGPCTVGLESTIISLCEKIPRLLRPGAITLEQLRDALGEVAIDHALYEQLAENEQVSAPGMKYRHYAPKAPVTVVRGAPDVTAAYIARQLTPTTGVLCFSEYAELFAGHTVQILGGKDDLQAQAQEIFGCLRAFDDTAVTEIYAQCPPDDGLGLAIANRIQKAAGFHLITL